MKSLFLFLCLGLVVCDVNAQLSNIGGVDPNGLTNSDLKKLGFSSSDLQSVKAGVQSGAGIKKEVITDTIEDKEDTVTLAKKLALAEDSMAIAQASANRFKYVYGKSYFSNSNLKVFKSASHLSAPDDYILGPGDEINIAIWGYAEVSTSERIGDDGAIHPNLVGTIYLNGLTMGNARKLITAKFGNVYDLKNSQISIGLKYAKVIRVNIVGEVMTPGTYAVSSLNSAFNVLSLAGGLSDIGSVRNILIKRDNKVVKVLDVYKFLSDPTYSNDFFLKNNDYIIVQPAGKIVYIKGEVGRDGKYELTSNEGLSELIKYAGALTSYASVNKANVIRVDTNYFVMKELNLRGALKGEHVPLKSGDTVTIASIDGILMNFVKVEGSLHLNGKMQYVKGEKINQLIRRANGLRIDAYLGRAYVKRTYRGGEKKYFQINLNQVLADTNSAANMVLEDLDEFRVFSIHEFHDEYKVEITGAVRNPTTIDYTENLTLQDLIFFAGGLLHEASNVRIEVSRMVNYTENEDDSQPIKFIVETIEVSDNLELSKYSEYKLRPQDKVFVRFIEGFQYQRLVVLTGEFKYPGKYALLHNKETIRELVERAGGMTEGAFLQGAKMYRKADDKGELVVNFVELFQKNKEQYNYVMRSGDSIFVPKIDDIIAISGEVGSNVVAGRVIQNSPFTRGKRAKFYIKEYAGGFSKHADRRKVYVISSSGGMKKTKDFLIFKVYPKVKRGDRIVVDQKPPEKIKDDEPTDWNKVIENLTVKITGIMTLYLLTKNVFK